MTAGPTNFVVSRLPTRTSARVIVLICAVAGTVLAAADRHWQTATCVDAGVKRDGTVGGGSAGVSPFGPASTNRSSLPEVATYVVETEDQRLEVQDVASIGSATLNLTLGDRISVAREKKNVYIRDAHGVEHRFRLIKASPRKKS